MPEFPLTLSKDQIDTLRDAGQKLGHGPRRMAERILGQALVRERNGAPGQTNAERSNERVRRQLELARMLEQRGNSELDRDEKRALAAQYGVNERTIYRDLAIATAALEHRASAATPD